MSRMLLRSVAICAGLGFCLAVSTVSAHADSVYTYSVNMTFASQGSGVTPTFQGTITTANSSNNTPYIESVSGTLYGFSINYPTPVAGATDPINWVWNENGTYAADYNYVTSGGNVFGTFLMDGTPSHTNNFIDFSFNYSNSPILTFATNATLVDPVYGGTYPADGVNEYNNGPYTAYPMTSGSITQVDLAPEPSTFSLFLLAAALSGVLAFVRHKKLTYSLPDSRL